MPEMNEKVLDALESILKRGNQAEVKMEHGKVVVIEIRRKKVNIA